jgi:hypothetical protein
VLKISLLRIAAETWSCVPEMSRSFMSGQSSWRMADKKKAMEEA